MEALVESNYKTKPVNVSNFANPFLLLSSTKALNIIATQKKTSTRADSKIGVDRSSSTPDAPAPEPDAAPPAAFAFDAPAAPAAPVSAPASPDAVDAATADIAATEAEIADAEDTISDAIHHPAMTDEQEKAHKDDSLSHPANAQLRATTGIFNREHGLFWAYETHAQTFVYNYRERHKDPLGKTTNPTIKQFLNKENTVMHDGDKVYRGSYLGGHAYVIQRRDGRTTIVVMDPNGKKRTRYMYPAGDTRINRYKGNQIYPAKP